MTIVKNTVIDLTYEGIETLNLASLIPGFQGCTVIDLTYEGIETFQLTLLTEQDQYIQ